MEKTEVITADRNHHFVILTVVSMNESSYGLQDYNSPFEAEELAICFLDEDISLENSLMAYNNYGRLTNPQINKWIQDNNLHLAPEPVKIVFQKQINGRRFYYILYKTQGNYLYDYFNQYL